MGKTLDRILKRYSDRLAPDAVDVDQDGYWVFPRWGWRNSEEGQHLIHEMTLREIAAVIKDLTFDCRCKECIANGDPVGATMPQALREVQSADEEREYQRNLDRECGVNEDRIERYFVPGPEPPQGTGEHRGTCRDCGIEFSLDYFTAGRCGICDNWFFKANEGR